MRERVLVATACAVMGVVLFTWLVRWQRGVWARASLRRYGCVVSGDVTGWFVTITPKTPSAVLPHVGRALVALQS
ncbi:MAG: hypothetical protein ACRD4O_06150, partial [Bryobacteraceae bacterium]